MADVLQLPNQQLTPTLEPTTAAEGSMHQPGQAWPGEVAVKVIDNKSADWVLYHYTWDQMYLLYTGGCEIEACAEQFLKKRAKELSDVYQSRIERFAYENHVGTCIDYYISSLFETPPQVETAVDPEDVKAAVAAVPPPPKPDLKDLSTLSALPTPAPANIPKEQTPAAIDPFYDEFETNADRAGTPLLEVWRSYFRNLLIYGRAALLVDLPPKGDYANAKEEREAGQFDPYLCQWDPRQMINYQKDQFGKLKWVVFSNRETKMDDPLMPPVQVDNWFIFDTTSYAHYQRTVPETENTVPDSAKAQLISQGPHALTSQKQVPVLYMEIPKGLWLMNRGFSPAKNHVNVSNVLDWALYMACLAMPVIKMDGDFTLTLSEAGFIKLPLDAEYSWAEPEGKSFIHLANRIETLREEIFRAFYLVSQARTNSATPAAASGLSKQQDMTASKKIMNMFGDVMRMQVQQGYTMVSRARNDETEWDVRGLEFPEGPPDEEVDTVAGAMAIDVPSVSFEKELYKKTVMAVLPDMNPSKKEQIFAEIESAPSRADRDLMGQQQQSAMLMQRVQQTQAKDTFPNGSV